MGARAGARGLSRVEPQLPTKASGANREMTLTEEMKPLLLVMRGINIMPLQFPADGSGSASCSWRSRVALMSALVWAATFADVLHETGSRVQRFLHSANFSEAVFETFFFLLLHHHYFTPVLHWPAAPRFADHLAEWNHFQNRFLRVTGRPLRLSVRSLASHKAVASLVVPVILVCAMACALDSVNPLNLPLGFLAAVFHASVPAFWDVLGTAVVNSSDALSRHLKEEVALSGGAPSPSRVRAYRELWLELRSLTERAPTAWGVCTLHYLVCCISAVLLNGFGLLAAATQSDAVDPVMCTGMFLITVDSLWHTAVVCAAGQRMASSVGSGARDVLLAMRTSPDPDPDPHPDSDKHVQLLQREVKSFLNLMRRPLVISLYGFISLKVTLIVTIMETLTTYLCVLLQFTINFQ